MKLIIESIDEYPIDSKRDTIGEGRNFLKSQFGDIVPKDCDQSASVSLDLFKSSLILLETINWANFTDIKINFEDVTITITK